MDSSSHNDTAAGLARPDLHGLDPADLLRQGAADDTAVAGERPAFTPPSLEKLAAIFPQFEILTLLGQGGMGAVYQVRQKALDRVVALKILPKEISSDPAFAGQFTREARALAQLNHPGIVTLYEFGQTEGLYFFLMEYVDGLTLRRLLEQGRLATREALAIVPQICDALQYAHDHGIVHRDIKPENILLDKQGRVKVADFGLAKLVGPRDDPAAPTAPAGAAHATLVLQGGKVLGTPAYMAPEQKTTPLEVDHRVDIYALGVVFYQMLTGELPGQPLEVPSHKVTLDVRLDEVVLRALEQQPELRFQQASVMKTRVEEIGASTAPLPAPRKNSPWWLWALLAGMGLLLIAFLLSASLWFLAIPTYRGVPAQKTPLETTHEIITHDNASIPATSTDLATQELPLAVENLRITQARYEAGVVNALELEEAKGAAALLQARQTGDPEKIARAKYDTALARIALLRLRVESGLTPQSALLDAEREVARAQQEGAAAKSNQAQRQLDQLFIQIALQWLALIDEEKYEKSYAELPSRKKILIGAFQWESTLRKIRTKFRGIPERKLKGVETVTALPGEPDGDYLVITFATSFTSKAADQAEAHVLIGLDETVILEKTPDGTWAPMGYSLNPSATSIPAPMSKAPGATENKPPAAEPITYTRVLAELEGDLKIKRARYEKGDIDILELYEAEDALAWLKAQETGVTEKIVAARLAAAQRKVTWLKARFDAGAVSKNVLAEAENNLSRVSRDAFPEAELPSQMPKVSDVLAWLAPIDSGKYEEAYESRIGRKDMPADFPNPWVKKDQWIPAVAKSRNLLGQAVSRKLADTTFAKSDLVIFQFKTKFSLQKWGLDEEFVLLGRDKKSTWKVYNYGCISGAHFPQQGVVETWQALIDAGNFKESYAALAESAKSEISEDRWTALLTEMRRPFGNISSRVDRSVRSTAINGQRYERFRDAHFSNGKAGIEKLVFERNDTGVWKPVSYSIQEKVLEPRVEDALAWLTLIDAGKYAESFDAMSAYAQWEARNPSVKGAVTLPEELDYGTTNKLPPEWRDDMEKSLKPFGSVVSRKLKLKRSTVAEPRIGVDHGTPFEMIFETDFSNKKRGRETITFEQEADGTWKPAGYSIQKMTVVAPGTKEALGRRRDTL